MQAFRSVAMLLFLGLSFGTAQADPIAGTWRLEQAGQVVEITLGADGQFARRDRGPDGQAMEMRGQWQADGAEARLRVTIEDWAPRRVCGLVGCTAIRMLPGGSYRYRLRDADTLMLEDAGGRMTLRRAG